MRTMRTGLILAAGLLALAGCGQRETLRPAAGETLPTLPGTTAPADADTLLTRLPEQQPERNEELLRRSHERQDDRFNLPPPG